MPCVVKVVNETQVPVMHFTNPPIQYYQKHVARHAPSSKVVLGTRQPMKSFKADDAAAVKETQLSRGAVEYVIKRSEKTKEVATKALEDNAYEIEVAVGAVEAALLPLAWSR